MGPAQNLVCRVGGFRGIPRVPAAIAMAYNNVPSELQLQKASQRVQETDPPCIVKTRRLMAANPGAVSLAQGIVHWQPPRSAVESAAKMVLENPSVNSYGTNEGLPELTSALKSKLTEVNNLPDYNVMVTAGANHAFVNIILSLCDSSDRVMLFKPYYFNHMMAIQMTGGGRHVVLGECDPNTLHPDLDWLESALSGPSKPKMVVVTNPCNPTGVLLSEEEVNRLSLICEKAGVWLVLDNTYEYFVFDGRRHFCPSGRHVLHIFSFSKAYGMMGWRIGYIAYPDFDDEDELGAALLKVQDTILVCAPQLNQHVALGAMRAGSDWPKKKIQELAGNKKLVMDALSPLNATGSGVTGGEGAIYYWAQLPQGCEDDEKVIEWLLCKFGVCVIPGSSCGMPGYIRAAFANLTEDKCKDAAAKLKRGLQELVNKGPSAMDPL